MDPNDIELNSIEKIFEYEKKAREIDSCEDIDLLKKMLKFSVKLHLQKQEILSSLGSVQV